MARARRNGRAISNNSNSRRNNNNNNSTNKSKSSKSLRSTKNNDNVDKHKTSLELARDIINATRAANSKPQTITVTNDGSLIIQSKQSRGNDNSDKSNSSRKKNKNSTKTNPEMKGLRSIDGHLYPSDDLRVLLRDASLNTNNNNNNNNNKNNNNRNQKYSNNRNKNNNSNSNHKNIKFDRLNIKKAAKQANRLVAERAMKKMVEERQYVSVASNMAVSPYSIPSSEAMLKNKLVINTNSKVSDQLLVIYNLTTGTNSGNLKKIIQNLSRIQVADLIVKDLPTGSAVAYITLHNQTLDVLQKLRDFFNGALIDGRTVKVEIISKAIAGLTY